jgi:signal transducing adaptor molecule
VKKKALGYIKSWAKQFEEAGDSNLGLMGELYDQLRAKSWSTPFLFSLELIIDHTFDEPEPVPEDRVSFSDYLYCSSADAQARTRQEAEDDELQRVLELSKQDRGGRNQPGFGGGSASSSAPPPQAQPQPQRSLPKPQQFSASPAPAAPPREPTPPPLDINSATRVRALYTFSSNEVGELNFERGDMIKVLDRGFQEWWRGACNYRSSR